MKSTEVSVAWGKLLKGYGALLRDYEQQRTILGTSLPSLNATNGGTVPREPNMA